MNAHNAWGFFSFGLVMGLLPVLAPAWFPPIGIDGSSGRALWLELMGAVQVALGGLRVLQDLALPALARWLALAPSPLAPMMAFAARTAESRPLLSLAGARVAEAA